MKLIYTHSILLFFFTLSSFAQLMDCTLGIGGKDTETIIKVFQLNDKQLVQMETWIQDLKMSNEGIREQIDNLLEKHPQSNPEEIQSLAQKFKPLRDQMISNSKKCDQKLLGILNENQYRRYISLCEEAARKPLAGISSEEIKTPE